MLKNKKLLIIIAVCLVACIGVALGLFAILGGTDTPGKQTGGETTTYTIEVKSATGIQIKDVSLFIYEDSTLAELVSVITTDETGVASFTDVARDTYVAVIEKVPTGYEAEPYYPITGERTEIVLSIGQMSEADIETLTYKLGDAMMDFSVTGPDGTVYTLSGLFEGKKAVVLNFFYNECQPCLMEFPYLQEAYEEYKDVISVLAMNPVNTDDAAIAALQKKLGITFPMVRCGAEWESIMQLTAYPTTVIIDRYGNIGMIHKGSVPDAKTFKDAFAHFTQDEYEQKPIEKIEDLKVEEPEGTQENPTEVGGQNTFEVTVEPGQVVYHDLYKVFKMYLQIRSENAYVIYNGQTYYPKNGVVGLLVSAPDTFTPATIGIGNSGTETETFKVSLSALKGSHDNPYSLTLGEVDVSVAAGNEQGVYYTYTATEDGTLTLQCLSATSGIKYSYYLYNLSSSVMNTLEADGVADGSGNVSVSIKAKKGQTVQVCVSTLPDGNNSYPAGNFKFKVSFTPGVIQDQVVEQKTDYTVTVLDDQNQPIPNVSVVIDVSGTETGFTTDKNGVAYIKLAPGSYSGSLYVPDGYTTDVTTFTLTEAAPNVSMTINKIRQADYTVKVVGPTGDPVANVFVRIGENTWQRTDANGTMTMNLDVGAYGVTIMVPAGYSGETTYAFAAGATELTITLGYPLGSEQNPDTAQSYPFNTGSLAAQQEYFCWISAVEGMVGISIQDADAYIRIEETTYGADVNGAVNVTFEPGTAFPVLVAIGNSGTASESYAVQALYPVGSEKNPEKLTTLGDLEEKALEAGNADGYYYAYTATQAGTFCVQVTQSPSVPYEIALAAGNQTALLSQSDTENQVAIALASGETVLIRLYALADAVTGEYPAMAVKLRTAFDETEVEPGPGEPTDPSDPSEPTEPVPDPDEEVLYTVTVTDIFGAVQPDVGVIFMQEGTPVGMVNTDANGVAQQLLFAGDYTVELFFTGEDFYYDKSAAALTANNRELTIELAAHLDESKYESLYILNANPAYCLYVGGTHVQIGSGKPNFSAEYENNCFFVFTPETDGTYQITSNTPGVELSFWGGSTSFINKQYSSADEGRNNAITESIFGTSVGNTTYIIGVKVDGSITDVVLNVARIGDPAFNVANEPWTQWESGLTHTDGWMNEVGMTAVTGNGEVLYYTLNSPVTYLDITAANGTYNLYYDAANGYYRLYQGGPVVLVDLNATGRFVSLYERINGNGQYGGSAVNRYFFDNTGAFVKKEDYTEYLSQCFDCVALNSNSESGYHPLTKDLMYALQNGFVNWWDASSDEYLEGFATANQQYAWMFACCYVSN